MFHSTENMRNWSLSVYVVNMNMSFHTYFGGCFANFNKFFLCHLFKIKIKWNCRDERLQWHWFLCTMAESSIVVWTNTKSESISYNQVRNGWTALHHSPHFIRVYRFRMPRAMKPQQAVATSHSSASQVPPNLRLYRFTCEQYRFKPTSGGVSFLFGGAKAPMRWHSIRQKCCRIANLHT